MKSINGCVSAMRRRWPSIRIGWLVFALCVLGTRSAGAQSITWTDGVSRFSGPMAIAASAQGVHPCAAVVADNPTIVGTTVKAGFCWTGKRNDGQTLPDAQSTARVFLDANATPTVTAVLSLTSAWTKSATAAPNGQFYYETTTGFPVSVGAHTARLTVSNTAGESAGIGPFAFSVGPAPWDLPAGLRIVGSL